MSLDHNLKFLVQASNDDLLLLCDIVTKEKDGTFRATETLSPSYSYQRNYPHNIKKMLPDLIHEFRLFGGNSILNFFRGEGPEYSEILRDVAKKCNVSLVSSRYTDKKIEHMLLDKLVRDTVNGASDSDLSHIMHELEIPLQRFDRSKAIYDLEKLWLTGKIEGFMLMSSVIGSLLNRLTGHFIGSVFLGGMAARLSTLMFGPLGFILSSIHGAIDLAGPAYRVTIPGVIQIAYIRQKLKYNLK